MVYLQHGMKHFNALLALLLVFGFLLASCSAAQTRHRKPPSKAHGKMYR